MSSDSDSGPEDRNESPSVKTKSSKKGGKEPEAKKRKHDTSKSKDHGSSSSDEDQKFDLGGNKYISVSMFRRQPRVDIREHYTDKESGELRPGKKGVNLSEEQWEKLKGFVKDVDRKLEGLK